MEGKRSGNGSKLAQVRWLAVYCGLMAVTFALFLIRDFYTGAPIGWFITDIVMFVVWAVLFVVVLGGE